MKALRTLTTDRTHLFAGARLVLDGAEPQRNAELVVLFSDGARAESVLSRVPQGLSLHVEEYRTRAGTSIPAKDWDLSRDPDGGLRVVGSSARPI
jgi:hypothetical protein